MKRCRAPYKFVEKKQNSSQGAAHRPIKGQGKLERGFSWWL
jgi:hypothetical protein